jgi:hypothetical protein
MVRAAGKDGVMGKGAFLLSPPAGDSLDGSARAIQNRRAAAYAARARDCAY